MSSPSLVLRDLKKFAACSAGLVVGSSIRSVAKSSASSVVGSGSGSGTTTSEGSSAGSPLLVSPLSLVDGSR